MWKVGSQRVKHRSKISGGRQRATGWSANRSDTVLTAATGLMAALPFLLSPIRARVLGAAGRGYFAFFQSSVSLVAAIAGSGVILAFYSIKIRPANSGSISLHRSGLVGLLLCVPVGILLAIIAFIKYNGLIGSLILGCTIMGPLWVINQYQTGRFQVARERRMLAATVGGPAVVEFVGTATAWALGSLDLVLAVLITTCAEIYRVTLTFVSRRKERSAWIKFGYPDDQESKQGLVSKSLTLMPVALAPMLMSNLDLIIFGALVTPVELGIYAVARLGASILLPALAALQGTLVRAADQGRGLIVLSKLLLLIGVVCIFAAVFGYVFIPRLFGADFANVGIPFTICVLGGFARITHTFLGVIAVRIGFASQASKGALMTVGLLALGSAVSGISGQSGLYYMCSVVAISPIPTSLWLMFVVWRDAPKIPTARFGARENGA